MPPLLIFTTQGLVQTPSPVASNMDTGGNDLGGEFGVDRRGKPLAQVLEDVQRNAAD